MQDEEIDIDLKQSVSRAATDAKKYIESNFDVSKALASVFEIFSKANKYIEVTEPYRLAKDENKKERLGTVLRNLLEAIRIGTILLSAFLPDCSKKVADALDVKEYVFDDVKSFYKLKEGFIVEDVGMLFPRLDTNAELEALVKIAEEK